MNFRPVEAHVTREQLQETAINFGLGVLGVVLALASHDRPVYLAVLPYWLIGPAQWIHGVAMRRRLRRLQIGAGG